MIKITKVQDIGGSMTTTIPSLIRDLYNIKKGDAVQWEVDFGQNPPIVTLKTPEK